MTVTINGSKTRVSSLVRICLVVLFKVHMSKYFLVSGESQVITVTAEPPPSSSPNNNMTGEFGMESTEESLMATLDSLNFRLRYVEEVMTIFSHNMKEIRKRLQDLESNLIDMDSNNNTAIGQM